MCKKVIKSLGDAELEIMQVIWQSKEPVTSNYILEKLEGLRKWKLSTLMTVLARLAEKGFVNCDRSTKTNYYTAIICEEEYLTKESKTFLKKLYGNSFQGLVNNLYSSKVIDETDLSELRKFLDETQEGGDNQ